jgi:hypothetical protein
MKSKLHNLIVALALLAVSTLNSELSTARAQNALFTYQGQVLDNGSNFTGAGQFEFALVTSTNMSSQATATAVMGGTSPYEFVENFNLTYGGSGYVSAPTVTIAGGGGSNAAAQASISAAGVVTNFTITNPGADYTSTPTVTIGPPPADISYTTYWSNDGTSVAGSEPGSAVSVEVNNGLFSVVLGNTTLANMGAIPASIFTEEANLQLRVWFSDGVNGFAALSPVQNLTPTPYAIQALNASNLLGTLSAGQLIGAVPNAGLSGTYSNEVILNNVTNSFSGAFAGNGGGLTNLNVSAAQLTGGGNNNLFVGPSGNKATTGGNNTAIGYNALQYNTSGNNNTAVGTYALQLNTNGSYNTALGEWALGGYTEGNGSGNTASGYYALTYNNNGNNNTANGYLALEYLGNGNGAGGTNNIALGYLAGANFTENESGNIDIGNEGVAGENYIIRIGTKGTQTNAFIAGISGVTAAGGVAVYVNANGQLGTLNSSARFKKDIQSMGEASDVLLSLHPVTFKYKAELDPQGLPQFGLVAEEVEKVDPDLVARDEQGKIYTVRYEAVNAMLLNEFLKQHRTVEEQDRKVEEQDRKVEEQDRKVEEQRTEIQDLKKQNDSLADRLNELEATVKALKK